MSLQANDLFVIRSDAGHVNLVDGLINRVGKIRAAALMIGANDEDWSNEIRQDAAANIADLASECHTLACAIHDDHRGVVEELNALEAQRKGGKA